MAIDFTNLSTVVQGKLNAFTTASSNEEVLLVAKSIQATIGNATVSDIINQGNNSLTAISGASASAVGSVNAAGSLQVTNVNAAAAAQISQLQSAGTGAGSITFAPTGFIASTNVQAALAEIDNEKLAKASNLADLQSVSAARSSLGLATVATSGSYNDLADKPSASAAVSASTGAEVRTSTNTTHFVNPEAYAAATAIQTIAYAATLAIDYNSVINGQVTLTGNMGLGQHTNAKDGWSGVIYFIQDATGSRAFSGFNTTYNKFPGATPFTLSTAPNSVDRAAYVIRNRGGTLVTEWGNLDKAIG